MALIYNISNIFLSQVLYNIISNRAKRNYFHQFLINGTQVIYTSVAIHTHLRLYIAACWHVIALTHPYIHKCIYIPQICLHLSITIPEKKINKIGFLKSKMIERMQIWIWRTIDSANQKNKKDTKKGKKDKSKRKFPVTLVSIQNYW